MGSCVPDIKSEPATSGGEYSLQPALITPLCFLLLVHADAWHERLVRYYSYFGFKPVCKVCTRRTDPVISPSNALGPPYLALASISTHAQSRTQSS